MVVVALVAVVGGGIAAAMAVLRGGNGPNAADSRASSDARPGARPCTTLKVLASEEDGDLIKALAKAYDGGHRDVAGHCVAVDVSAMDSGQAAQAASDGFASMPADGRPTIWWPDSTDWLAIAHAAGRSAADTVPDHGVSVARTPMVLAVPRPQAAALGWDKHPPRWSDYLHLTSDPARVWAEHGHASWGTFQVGKTDPQQATAGLDELLAAYRTAAGTNRLSPGTIDSRSVQEAVRAAERATAHYGSSEENFLVHVREASATGMTGNALSVIAVQEKSVYDYNSGHVSMAGMGSTDMGGHGAPSTPLMPIYPRDGTYVADTPAAVLDGSWVDDAQRAAAEDLVAFARGSDGQAVVRSAGYRDIDDKPDRSVAKTGHYESGSPEAWREPSAGVLRAAQQSFPSIRKPARVLFAVDVSGSMWARLPDGHTKIEDAQAAVRKALGYFTDSDKVGLAAFSNGPGDTSVTPGVVVTPAALGDNRSELESAIGELSPSSETPLYGALSEFVDTMASDWDPNDINAIVLLSDGRNDTEAAGTMDSLTRTITTAAGRTPVRIFTLGYGRDADVPTLQRIAELSGAHYYDATDPANIGAVLSDLVTNF